MKCLWETISDRDVILEAEFRMDHGHERERHLIARWPVGVLLWTPPKKIGLEKGFQITDDLLSVFPPLLFPHHSSSRKTSQGMSPHKYTPLPTHSPTFGGPSSNGGNQNGMAKVKRFKRRSCLVSWLDGNSVIGITVRKEVEKIDWEVGWRESYMSLLHGGIGAKIGMSILRWICSNDLGPRQPPQRHG